MRSFFDFSNDTFYQIINHIHPDDILNFSVSCKWVHMMTKATLKQHASWTQAYTHVVLDGCHRHQNDRHPLRLIRDVCLDWRIGELPKTLELECCGVVELDEDDSDVQEDEEEHENETRVDEIAIQAIMQDDKGYIEKKAAATGYLDRDQLDNLFAYIQCGYRGAMIGLLLLILPNLESISFREFTWNAASLTTIADLIADRNLQSHPPRSIALGKLSHIHIFDYKNNPRGEDLEFLVPFAALPSMRKLSGISVITVDDDPMIWPFDLRVSNVTYDFPGSNKSSLFRGVGRIGLRAMRNGSNTESKLATDLE